MIVCRAKSRGKGAPKKKRTAAGTYALQGGEYPALTPDRVEEVRQGQEEIVWQLQRLLCTYNWYWVGAWAGVWELDALIWLSILLDTCITTACTILLLSIVPARLAHINAVVVLSS